MKAKEYLEKYGSQLSSPDFKEFEKAAQGLMLDLYQDFMSLIKIRNIKLDSGAVSLIEEINKKGNTVVSYIENCRLRKNFFKETLCKVYPEFVPVLEARSYEMDQYIKT